MIGVKFYLDRSFEVCGGLTECLGSGNEFTNGIGLLDLFRICQEFGLKGSLLQENLCS